MDPQKKYFVAQLLVCAIWLFTTPIHKHLYSQTPEILGGGTISQQYEFIHQRTNIYNNFRAIREDMFQIIRQNSIDSLAKANSEITLLGYRLSESSARMDSLNNLLENAHQQRDIAVKERNSMFFVGIPIQKTFYNLIVWSIIAGLLVLMALGYILYRRNSITAIAATKDLKELREEFESYRKKSRERYEQQAIDHFNEIRRLKGKS